MLSKALQNFKSLCLTPTWSSLLSRSPGPTGEGGHYGEKSIPDADFESCSSSSSGDMTSQNFPNKSSNSAIYPRKTGLTLKKFVFVSRIVLLDPKLTTHVNFSNFQIEENFFVL